MDQDLKLRNEWDEVESAFLAAKKNRDKDPGGYAAAKAELHAMRTHWRGIRDAVTGSVAQTVETKASNQ